MTTSGTSPVAHTALVLGQPDSGSYEYQGTVNPYSPGYIPKKVVCASREAAQALGTAFARENDATLLITSGTRSMEPLIHGQAYVVVRYFPFDAITKGDLLVYQGRPSAATADRMCMLHRAVLLDKGGWLMCGDNNRWTESWDRVTPVTYMGTVTTILEFPQA